MAGTVYLLNNMGRILWKTNIKEPINSEVFQVDYFKNNKLQYLFSTQNYIHLIDRNGNYIERYPLKLPAPLTTGISVFDYENRRDYRIFAPCSDRKVYLFSIDGNTIKDWQFGKTDSYVFSPVQHFTIDDKDYLVFADSLKTYILDRKGNVRVKVKGFFPKSHNNRFILDKMPKGGSRLVTTDSKGKVCFIYFDGKVETLPIGEFSENHYFDYCDVNGDGSKDFVFLDDKMLSVYKNAKTIIFSYKFNETINRKPVFYDFSGNEQKLGIVSSSENKIFLFNSNGSLYAGFPLKGRTMFSIGHLGKSGTFNLIVGGDDNFLYNYEVY
jgi:hypothetical protein